MTHSTLFFLISTLCLTVSSTLVSDAQTVLPEPQFSFYETCQEIADFVSATSSVYYPGSPEYQTDIGHWIVSSTQYAACSFRPSTAEDVGIALRILGRTRTPFAIKGGGHTSNPGFSSTPGVQIAMSRFSDVVYNPSTETVTLGAGLIWDDVYEALEPYGVNVVGGRAPGAGVAGFTLGGGYSWLTNQHGLTIDTVQMFELVLPNGIAINVTESSNLDLFFALKGGMNNFGIVTRFTLKAFPQTPVWGGKLTFHQSYTNQVNRATVNFAECNNDPRAVALTSYVYDSNRGPLVVVHLFYNAPEQPIGIFDEFLAIPFEGQPLVQSFLQFVMSGALEHDNKSRGVLNGVAMTKISLSFVETVAAQSEFWGKHLIGSTFINFYGVPSYLPTIYDHNTSSSAWPPDRTRGFLPIDIYYGWMSLEVDEVVYNATRATARVLREHGSDIADQTAFPATYPNFAIFDTPLVDMYGAHTERLEAIHAEIDPQNVMGLAGGFKF